MSLALSSHQRIATWIPNQLLSGVRSIFLERRSDYCLNLFLTRSLICFSFSTGIALKPNEPAELELREGESLHVSMASLGPQLKDQSGRSVVTIETGELEKTFAVCVLNAGKTESLVLDITLEGDEKITFQVTGKNEVHLVGNFSFDDNAESDEDTDDELIDVYDGNAIGMEVDDDDEDSIGDEGSTLMVDEPPVISELANKEEEDKETVNSSKKLNKGKRGKKENVADKKQGNKPKNGKAVKENKTLPTQTKTIQKKAGDKKFTPKKPAEKPAEKVVEKAVSKPLNSGKRKNPGAKNETPAKKPKAEEKKSNGMADAKTPEKTPSTPNAAANGSGTKSAKRKKRAKSRKTGTPTSS